MYIYMYKIKCIMYEKETLDLFSVVYITETTYVYVCKISSTDCTETLIEHVYMQRIDSK